MFKLGQDVTIYDTPLYGDECFDEDDVYELATICGVTIMNDEVVYQLDGYDEDSWWTEDELDEYSDGDDLNNPIYKLGDEVVVQDNPREMRHISHIYMMGGEFVYWVDDKTINIDECELAPCQTEYTLF